MVKYDIKKIVLLPIVSKFIFLGNLNYVKVKSEVEKQQSSGKQHMWALFFFINSSGKKNCQSKHIDSQSTKTHNNFGYFEFKFKTILYVFIHDSVTLTVNQSMIMMMVMV